MEIQCRNSTLLVFLMWSIGGPFLEEDRGAIGEAPKRCDRSDQRGADLEEEVRLVGVGGEVRRKWRSDEPMQGDKHENSMKIEYSARLVVPAHEMAFSEGDRGAIDRGAIIEEEVRVLYRKFENVGLLFTLLSRGSLLLLVQAH